MEKKGRKYVFVLDYVDGRVYRYDVWFDDSEKIEEYLDDMGHSIGCLLYTSPSPRDS